MFYNKNAKGLSVNCAVVPNTDVSGIGARGSIYVQAVLSILTLVIGISPDDVILTTLSVQISAAALILSAYIDQSIDVPHTIVASQFAVLLSTCRVTSYDITGDSHSEKALSQIWLLDIICRPILLIFNIQVWSAILDLQKHSSRCPSGFGSWRFFSKVDLSRPSASTDLALAYCILDAIWEILRYLSDMRRAWILTGESPKVPQEFQAILQVDPRTKFLRKVLKRKSISKKRLFWASVSYKLFLTIYTVIAVELTISDNALDSGEDRWSFGQIFALINMCGMLAATVLAFWKRNYDLLTENPGTSIFWTLYLANFFLLIPLMIFPMANTWHERDPDAGKWAYVVGASLIVLAGSFAIAGVIFGAGWWVWDKRNTRIGRALFVCFLPVSRAFGFEGPIRQTNDGRLICADE